MDGYTLLYIRDFFPCFPSQTSIADDTGESSTGAALLSPLTVTHTVLSADGDIATGCGSPLEDGFSTCASSSGGGAARGAGDWRREAETLRAVRTPLALLAAHPSIRSAFQRLSATPACPHGHTLHCGAHQRFRSRSDAAAATRITPWAVVAAGRVDCAWCQQGGALGRRALTAYTQQELHHNGGGCAVGTVRIAQAAASALSADAPRFFITLYGAAPSQRATSCRSASPVSCTSLPPFSQRVTSCSTPPPSSPQEKASDSAVQQLQLAVWWLRRCMRQLPLLHHTAPTTPQQRHAVDFCGIGNACGESSAMVADSSSSSSASRVRAAVACARSLHLARMRTRREARERAALLPATTTATVPASHTNAAPLSIALLLVHIPSSAVAEAYAALTALPGSCRVVRLLVRCAAVARTRERKPLAYCASSRSSSPLSFREIRRAPSHRWQSPAEVDDDDANLASFLHSPLPLPSRLPQLYAALEELVVTGLPAAASPAFDDDVAPHLRWAKALVGQLEKSAAPQLRRLVLLEGRHTAQSSRRGNSELQSPASRVASSSSLSRGTAADASPPVSPPPLLRLGPTVVSEARREEEEGDAAGEMLLLSLPQWSAPLRTAAALRPPGPTQTTAIAPSKPASASAAEDATVKALPLQELYMSGGVPCELIAADSPLPLPRDALSWVCRYPQLHSLNLSHSTVTDTAARSILSALPVLEELHLSWCVHLQDIPSVLRGAATRQLHVLNLIGLRALTNEMLEVLCMDACPHLLHTVEELYVAQCPITAVGCVAFACPQLTRLQLPDTTVLDATSAHVTSSEALQSTRGASPLDVRGGLSLVVPSSTASSHTGSGGGGGGAAAALSVPGYGGLVPILSRLFPRLEQLKVHGVDEMLRARATRPSDLMLQRPHHDTRSNEGAALTDSAGGHADDGDVQYALDAARAGYAEFLRHGEFYDLHRLLPHLAALYLDGCSELGQLVGGADTDSSGDVAASASASSFLFGGTVLSLAGAVHDLDTLERLLTWRRGAAGGTLQAVRPHRGEVGHTSPAVRGLQVLRLSGCRSLRPGPMARLIVRCCPQLRVLSVADTLINDAALARLCEGLHATLSSLDLSGANAVTDVSPLLSCAALRQVRLPGGQTLTARTMAVEFMEGLRGLCALLGRLCPDLRRLQLHSRGGMDVAEVAEVALMGRWVTEVDLSQVIGMNMSTMLALNVPTAPANVQKVLTRVNLSNTAMNNTMLRVLVNGVVGPVLQELRLHGCHCVSDVGCLATRCARLRVLKLSGTSVDASSLASLTTALPQLADLDVRYCARVRDVHWLAEALRRAAELRRQQQEEERHQQQQRSITAENAGDRLTRCSRCPVLRAHRPALSLTAIRDAAAHSNEARSAAPRPMAAAVVASPLTSGRTTGCRRSSTCRDAPPPSLPTPPPLCAARSMPSAAALKATRASAGEAASCPLRCLRQVAFGNNHCYLSADPTATATAAAAGEENTESSADDLSAAHTPPAHTVVLQEAVPGLFAVLSLWRPQTRVLVLLRPGSMGTVEWQEVDACMPQLRIQEVAV